MPDIWDELKTRIVIAEDHVLFDEATNAARSGALRASYIAVWLSCAESLKRKFKDASTTDAGAAKTFGDITAKEALQHAVDAFVLEESKKYGFISDTEYTQLKNVYDQRCVYGHPYEQAPLPVQLHAAATIAVEYVLGRPTKLKHGYLDRQVDLICTNLTYLDDHYTAVENCAKIVYHRSSPDVHLWFLQKMWQEFSPKATDPAMALYCRRVLWFTSAFLQCFEPTVFPAWNAVQDLTRYPFISYALATSDLFLKVDQHAQDIIIGNLLTWSQSQMSALRGLQQLNDACVLNVRQVERFVTALDAFPINLLASTGIHPQYYFTRIIEAFRSYNWYVQGPAVEVVRTLGPVAITQLNATQQLELGNNVLQAANGGCNSAATLITEISRGQELWPEAFIEGVIAECIVNSNNQYRFKLVCASSAISCIKAVDPAAQVLLINRIGTRLQAATPKHAMLNPNDRDSLVAVIDAVMTANATTCGYMQPLKNAVAGLRI